MTHFIDFGIIGRRGKCPEGYSLLECARSLGVDLANICGGGGSCGSCLVQVVDGDVSPIVDSEREHISDESLLQGYRLACYTFPKFDCKVRVPVASLTTQQRIQVEGQEMHVDLDPVAKSYFVKLSPPSLDDQRSDAERVAEKLTKEFGMARLSFDFTVLGDISTVLRKNHWEVSVVTYLAEVIAILPAGGKLLGLAVDLGTTKIAIFLVDLETGQTLTSKGIMNPQIAYGEDIMTRMTAAQTDPKAASLFQSMIVDALNDVTALMCEHLHLPVDHIVNIVIVGNTAMHHLFLGFPIHQLGRAPYVPAVASSLDIKARDLGLSAAPGACVHFLPNIAGYVGADHVSMLLASDINDKQGVVLAIDIGTNTEICLSNKGLLTCLSTASGPAFEGAHIKCGMRAASGAIERFQIIDEKNTYQTIGNTPATGLCGSGILDVLAQLYRAGIVNPRGRMIDHPRVRGNGIEREFVIASVQENEIELTFSQQDVEQLQLAKGAIRTGIDVLLFRNDLSYDDIDCLIIAGAFGTYLNVRSAIEIGMLPSVPPGKVLQVGNAAGVGAKLALTSATKREEAENLAKKISYIELAGDPQFMRAFAKSMRLGQ